jgi:hypothetical protein
MSRCVELPLHGHGGVVANHPGIADGIISRTT